MSAAPMAAPAVGPLRLATRRSELAMAQSRSIGEQLAALTGRELELVEVTTQGDVDPAPLTQIGGTGVFVVAVRQAVVDGRADVAVHSLKDLPTTPDPRLVLAAIPPREDPRDVLVARDGATLAGLPVGARVGTGSPRRRSQIAALRPDLELVEIRGNVGTRIARVAGPAGGGSERGGDLDAVVLAAAGLIRLGRQERMLCGGAQEINWESMCSFDGLGAFSPRIDDPTAACRPFDADRDGLVAARYGEAVLYLVRPDQHVAARFRAPTRAAILAAFARATGGGSLADEAAA